MLQYSPKTKRKSWFALLIAFLLMIVCWAASQTIEAYRLLFQIGSLIAAMLFIQITSRYLLPRYHYRLEGKMFSVIKVQGKRVSTLCHVDLSEAILLIDRRTLQKSKEKHPSLSCYNFCQNLFPDNPCRLYLTQNQKEVFILFEPDEIFRKTMIDQINLIKTEVSNHVH